MSTVKNLGAVKVLGAVLFSLVVIIGAKVTMNFGQAATTNEGFKMGTGCIVGQPAELEIEMVKESKYDYFLWQQREIGHTEEKYGQTLVKVEAETGYYGIQVFEDGEFQYQYDYPILPTEEVEAELEQAYNEYMEAKAIADEFRQTEEYAMFEARKCR